MADPLSQYLEGLIVTQGRHAGLLLRVLPWGRQFLIGAFRTGVHGAALSVARGNGKSALVAGIACAAVDGPLAQARGEVVCVASAFGQAKIVFEHVLAFMRDRMNAEPKRWRIQDSANLAIVEDRATGGQGALHRV